MAEFTEVMRQAKRMCESCEQSCEKCAFNTSGESSIACPLVDHTGELIPMDWDLEQLAYIEHLVMHWAAEHPEPKYPPWNKGWKKLFPNAASKDSPCPKFFLDDARWDCLCDGRTCNECLETHMPADIAEKLGIKPIGGTDE